MMSLRRPFTALFAALAVEAQKTSNNNDSSSNGGDSITTTTTSVIVPSYLAQMLSYDNETASINETGAGVGINPISSTATTTTGGGGGDEGKGDQKQQEIQQEPPLEVGPSTSSVAGGGSLIGKARSGGGEFRVQVVPYSVLGTQLPVANMKSFVTVNNAPPPDENTCFLDAAGIHHVQGYAKKGPGGAAKAIYDHIGCILHPRTGLARFPAEVKAAVNEECDAKFFSYFNEANGQTFNVIHAVGPDFVPDRWPKNKPFPPPKPAHIKQAAQLLGEVYANTLREYASTTLPKLRLLPLSSGIFAGPMINHMPQLTRLGLEIGFSALSDQEQAALCDGSRQIDMCIFLESELEAYATAFSSSSLE